MASVSRNFALDLAISQLEELAELHRRASVDPSVSEVDQLRAQEDVLEIVLSIQQLKGLKTDVQSGQEHSHSDHG